MSTELQWQEVDSLQTTRGNMAAVAASLLLCNYPFQVAVPQQIIWELAEAALEPLAERTVVEAKLGSHYEEYKSLDYESRYKLFPTKAGPAEVKTNLWFTDVWDDLVHEYPAYASTLRFYGPWMAGLSNDQAVCVVIYGLSIAHLTPHPFRWAIRMLQDPTGCKHLSTALKALGANGTKLGACLAEAVTLQGRGESPVNLAEAARERTDIDSLHEKLFLVDQAKLYEVVRDIICEELDEANLEYPSDDKFWQSRWLWCVNGSHNKTAESMIHGSSVIPPSLPRSYRRAYAEASIDNPARNWRGRSYFSISAKLEHSKTRTIFGGDTDTYLAFERLLRPVEKAWRGRRVVLNPGHNGMAGVCTRVNTLRGQSGVNVMMDYDDFNSAHTLASQKTVFRALCDFIGYDEELSAKLISSFDNSYILHEGRVVGKLVGTLMSGHRATSFINTILNRAYLAIISPVADLAKSIHVGDDVFVTVPTVSAAARLFDDIGASSIRMNATKQSVGFVAAEFLRAAITPAGAYGYCARSIASVVSGNWVSEFKVSPDEGLNSLINSAWSITNRCGSSMATAVMVQSISRRTGLKRDEVKSLLNGSCALGNGPVRSGLHHYARMDPVRLRSRVRDKIPGDLPTHATRQYLTHCVSPIERLAIDVANIRPSQDMAAASYKKCLAEEPADVIGVKFARRPFSGQGMEMRGVTMSSLLRERQIPGKLSVYPLMAFLKTRLTRHDVAYLLSVVGVEGYDDIEVAAWGAEGHGMVVNGSAPRGDVCALSKRTNASLLIVDYQIHF